MGDISTTLRILLLLAFSFWSGGVGAQQQCVNARVVVGIAAADAWAILSDFSLAHLYVPGLTRTEIISAKHQGVGAHRRVYQGDDDYLDETIIQWREGGGFVLKLHEGEEVMSPFEQAEFSYSIHPAGEEQTAVDLTMITEMPWGRFGALLGDWFITPVVEDNLRGVAAGLKSFYETGQAATDEDRERLADQVLVSTGDAVCAALP